MSGVPTDPREGVGPDHLTRQDIQGVRHDYDNAVPRPKVLTPSPSRTPDPMRKVALAAASRSPPRFLGWACSRESLMTRLDSSPAVVATQPCWARGWRSSQRHRRRSAPSYSTSLSNLCQRVRGVTNCGSDAGRRAGVDVPAGSGLVVGINAPLSMMSATATIFGGWEQTTVAGALCALPAAVWEFSFGIYLTFSGFKTAPGSRTSN